MSKHTIQAPWRAGRGLSEAIFDAQDNFVATVGGRTPSEIRERAALIVSAPELLDALKKAAGWVVNDDCLAMIDQVIAKAEGGAA